MADRWKLFTTKKTADTGDATLGADDAAAGSVDLADAPPPAPSAVSSQPTHSELDCAPSGPIKGPPTIV